MNLLSLIPTLKHNLVFKYICNIFMSITNVIFLMWRYFITPIFYGYDLFISYWFIQNIIDNGWFLWNLIILGIYFMMKWQKIMRSFKLMPICLIVVAAVIVVCQPKQLHGQWHPFFVCIKERIAYLNQAPLRCIPFFIWKTICQIIALFGIWW